MFNKKINKQLQIKQKSNTIFVKSKKKKHRKSK